MKARFLLFLFLVQYFGLLGQSSRPKEFQLRGGLGVSGYEHTTRISGSFSILNFPVPFDNTYSGGAATVHVPLELRYELTRRIAVGLNARFGNYLYDPENADSNSEKSNRFWALGFAGEYNFVGRDHFRWYLGTSVHFVNLETYEVANLGEFPLLGTLTLQNSMVWKGWGSSFYTGVMWFVGGGPIGLNFNIGYDGAKLNLEEFSSSLSLLGNQRIVSGGELKVAGARFDAGLVFRIKMK